MSALHGTKWLSEESASIEYSVEGSAKFSGVYSTELAIYEHNCHTEK